MPDYLIPVLLALLTGGVAVKLLDNMFNTPSLLQKLRFGKEDRELEEIKRLRLDIDSLRADVTQLRTDIDTKIGEISILKERWYKLRTVVTSLITYLQHKDLINDDTELKRLSDEALDITESTKI